MWHIKLKLWSMRLQSLLSSCKFIFIGETSLPMDLNICWVVKLFLWKCISYITISSKCPNWVFAIGIEIRKLFYSHALEQRAKQNGLFHQFLMLVHTWVYQKFYKKTMHFFAQLRTANSFNKGEEENLWCLFTWLQNWLMRLLLYLDFPGTKIWPLRPPKVTV